MGFPNKATQFKPGQSGNPLGRRKRPDIDALNDLIAEKGLDKAIALTIVKQALGDEKKGVPPNFAYMKLLIEYRNGGAPKSQDDASEAEKVADDIKSIRELVDDIKATSEGPGARPDVGRGPGKPKRVRGA